MEAEVNLLPPDTLEETVKRLLEEKAKGQHVYCLFNGHRLESDNIDMDKAFLEVYGYTKDEFDKQGLEDKIIIDNKKISEMGDELTEEKKELIEEVQEITKGEQTLDIEDQTLEKMPEWIDRGQKLTFFERYEKWRLKVIERAQDIYHGEDLDIALEIMQALENEVSLEETKKMLYSKASSQDQIKEIRKIIFDFSRRGPEFYEFTATEELTMDEKHEIEEQKKSNAILSNEPIKSQNPTLKINNEYYG